MSSQIHENTEDIRMHSNVDTYTQAPNDLEGSVRRAALYQITPKNEVVLVSSITGYDGSVVLSC